MYSYRRLLKTVFLCFLFTAATLSYAGETPLVTDKVSDVLARVSPVVSSELSGKGLQLGAQIFIRIFKLPGELEVWVKDSGRYRLFKTYPVCNYSGYLGPKLREGDWQSPEGFYRVTPDLMNPKSSYHLSFNIGYPNEYDKLLNRTGSNIMVHGDCSSKGCFAMNNYRMEEIYTLAHSAFASGQPSIDVHIFPFRLTRENLDRYRYSPWIGFWKNLQQGYAAFERTRQVPLITQEKGRYVVAGTAKVAMSRRK
jgi:murein L,D-transpeptidase YafK